MTDSELTLHLTVDGFEEFRLFVWELRQLADKMRVEACPHAEALEHALDRFTDNLEDKGEQSA